MSCDSILEQVEKLYSDNITAYGIDPKSVGWRTLESQYLRFKKLTHVIQDDDPFTVNELGCGYGAMYQYFKDIRAPITLFRGYDISSSMLAEAEKLIGPQPDTRWIQDKALREPADYSFTSGIFNVRFEASDREWEDYILKTLTNLNSQSKKGFAFNLLTSYVDYREPHLYYGDPCFYFDYCKKHFSKKVTLFHDYPLWEWTICVGKN